MNTKTCAIIPVYNESKHIEAVIRGILKQNIDIYLIDDGSTDSTRNIVKKTGVNLICHDKNLGKGRSLRDGFAEALKHEYKYFITIDGDGQHDPEEIPDFIDRITSGGFDIIAGNRMNTADNMPKKRKNVNKKASRIISDLCHQKIPDPLCGYRILKREILESITLKCDGFNIVNEILIKASHKGYIIGNIDIKCIYGTEKSHIRPLRDLYYFIKLIMEIGKK